MGSGIDSDESDPMLVAGVPDQPLSGPTRGASTSSTLIEVDIAAVAGDNGSPITSYDIQIDDGMGGAFVELQGLTIPSLLLTATKSSGVTKAFLYRVKYRAKNDIGYGEYSDVTYILAASIPDASIPPTIVLENGDAKIAWTLPNNLGSEIFEAEITIKHSGSATYSTDLTNCDGADPTTFYNRYCLVPLLDLQGGPWNLV
mmetsp:Transcript_29133/g.28186  ORF Transcript_29133/g.28186 Transcript_29133/m.28186 type:complete len:201 (+) Transcript_29133:1094-1696(+)